MPEGEVARCALPGCTHYCARPGDTYCCRTHAQRDAAMAFDATRGTAAHVRRGRLRPTQPIKRVLFLRILLGTRTCAHA